MLLFWWRGNRFMHIKCCYLQLHPGKGELCSNVEVYSCIIYSLTDFFCSSQVQVAAPEPTSSRKHLY